MANDEKVRSLVRRIRELLDELDAELQERETPGQSAKRLLDFFVKHWQRKYPEDKYSVNGAKDMASFKRLLKTFTPDELAGKIRAYFQSSDPFIVNARHSIGVLCAKVNELAMVGIVRPRGCTHNPPCRDGAAHTRRQLEEDRAV